MRLVRLIYTVLYSKACIHNKHLKKTQESEAVSLYQLSVHNLVNFLTKKINHEKKEGFYE